MEKEKDSAERAMEEKAAAELKDFFEKMPHEVELILFSRPGHHEPFSEAARQVIRALRQVIPKISFAEHDLKHALARKFHIERSPTLLFAPEHYRVRWLGAPIGEEARTLVQAVEMIGFRRTNLSKDSLKILARIDTPRQIKLFVSPTCPYCPQQAVNALKAAFEKPELISLEIIDIEANPDLTARYSAQSVPQTFANEQLIALGAQPEELFMLSLEKMEQQTVFIPESEATEVEADVVIIGGGPAGLTAGIYTARSGLKSAVIERGILGGQVATTPTVENYPGLTQVGGKALVDIMVSHALEYINIFPGEEALDIKPGEQIEVQTNRRRFKVKAVILATGAVNRHLNVPGEARFAGRGISYCATCDGTLFKGKKVVVAGGGDSAVTEALYLHNIAVDVTLVHRGDRLRAQDFLVKSLDQSKIPTLLNREIKEILGKEHLEEVKLHNSRSGEETSLKVDGVFIAIGYEPAVELAKKIGIEIGPDGYIKHDGRHRTNIPGIYCAGDVEGGYKQIVIAAGKGSEAALAVFEDLIHPYWKRQAEAG